MIDGRVALKKKSMTFYFYITIPFTIYLSEIVSLIIRMELFGIKWMGFCDTSWIIREGDIQKVEPLIRRDFGGFVINEP